MDYVIAAKNYLFLKQLNRISDFPIYFDYLLKDRAVPRRFMDQIRSRTGPANKSMPMQSKFTLFYCNFSFLKILPNTTRAKLIMLRNFYCQFRV